MPESLKERWILRLGKTQELLVPLLEGLGSIDIFIHDSEHSYECMTFEYKSAWKHLDKCGLLISDDTGWNRAFFDFAKEVEEKAGKVAGNMGMIIKTRWTVPSNGSSASQPGGVCNVNNLRLIH